mmetsp:Transcript_39436/g.122982  ORF Transcript_39436/g.122982 Transcript_39436/m.122982 type:complete len:221 (-) Transcript_39436:798-1460(-)
MHRAALPGQGAREDQGEVLLPDAPLHGHAPGALDGVRHGVDPERHAQAPPEGRGREQDLPPAVRQGPARHSRPLPGQVPLLLAPGHRLHPLRILPPRGVPRPRGLPGSPAHTPPPADAQRPGARRPGGAPGQVRLAGAAPAEEAARRGPGGPALRAPAARCPRCGAALVREARRSRPRAPRGDLRPAGAGGPTAGRALLRHGGLLSGPPGRPGPGVARLV